MFSSTDKLGRIVKHRQWNETNEIDFGALKNETMIVIRYMKFLMIKVSSSGNQFLWYTFEEWAIN